MWCNKIIQKIGLDKIVHFAISALLTLIIGKWLNFIITAIIVLLLGIFKELLDLNDYSVFDTKDIIADLVGVIIGIIFLII